MMNSIGESRPSARSGRLSANARLALARRAAAMVNPRLSFIVMRPFPVLLSKKLQQLGIREHSLCNFSVAQIFGNVSLQIVTDETVERCYLFANC
jgi:hypothetical protein